MAKLITPTLAKSLKDMKKDIFAVASIDSTATYAEDGLVTITPHCTHNGQVLKEGQRVRQKGVLFTDDTGLSMFVPYIIGSGKRYTKLFATLNGIIYTTQRGNVIVKLTLPNTLTNEDMVKTVRQEIKDMLTYIKKMRKEDKE